MYLQKLTIRGFKNIEEANLRFCPKINSITGLNGVGKTNLLDAIYYLSMTKSFFWGYDQQSISYDSHYCRVEGEYLREDKSLDKIEFTIDREQGKQFKKSGKPYSRLADHIGHIPIVMVSPYDSCLINESGEERRKFINAILSQIDGEYLSRVQNYNQLLAQRNRLLKMEGYSEELLETFSERLSWNGSYIYKKRVQFTEQLIPIINRYFKIVSNDREEITIEYSSDLAKGPLDELLKMNRERDNFLKYTSVGVHRDDLKFQMDGRALKLCGSQGEQKSFLIALKLAQFEIIKEIKGRVPILLLDDVFDKLDPNRVEALLNIVSSDHFGQIFITDSNKVRIEEILERVSGDSLLFEIEEGEIKERGER